MQVVQSFKTNEILRLSLNLMDSIHRKIRLDHFLFSFMRCSDIGGRKRICRLPLLRLLVFLQKPKKKKNKQTNKQKQKQIVSILRTWFFFYFYFLILILFFIWNLINLFSNKVKSILSINWDFIKDISVFSSYRGTNLQKLTMLRVNFAEVKTGVEGCR